LASNVRRQSKALFVKIDRLSPETVMTITVVTGLSKQDKDTRSRRVQIVLQTTTGKLGSDLWQALDDLASARVYTKDSIIFEQGAVAAGVHIVEAGEVRIFLPSAHAQLAELCGPGTILGLSETMSGNSYRVSAVANDHATVAFIPQRKFMDFLRANCDSCMQIVRILSEDLHGLYHKFRTVTAHPGRPRHQPDQRQVTTVDESGTHLHR
jgi:hypothetical protein